MTKHNLLLVGIAFALLCVTHWFAYNSGVRYSIALNAPIQENIRDMDPYDALLAEVDALRAVTRCSEDFTREDIERWRTETEATLAETESTTLSYCQKTGDEGTESRVRARIEEARLLLSKLPR